MPDRPDPTPPTAPPEDRTAEARFADRLTGLSLAATRGEGSARARLARLRSAIGRRGVAPIAYREVGDALADVPPDQRETYLLVAALFALHAAKSDQPWRIRTDASLGTSCAQARRGGSVSIDLRFAALLDARAEDLPYRLRQVVALLAAGGVGVRYDVLLRDLLDWDAPRRSAQRRWAADYWAPTRSAPTS